MKYDVYFISIPSAVFVPRNIFLFLFVAVFLFCPRPIFCFACQSAPAFLKNMSSSVRETLDMIEQKLLSKKLEALHLLKRRCADRLLGGETATGSVGNCSAAENMDLYWADPRIQEYMYPKQENHWILQLPDVILEGPATLGTLEARGSGFIFTAPDFQLHFKDTSVKECFFSHGDDRRR